MDSSSLDKTLLEHCGLDFDYFYILQFSCSHCHRNLPHLLPSMTVSPLIWGTPFLCYSACGNSPQDCREDYADADTSSPSSFFQRTGHPSSVSNDRSSRWRWRSKQMRTNYSNLKRMFIAMDKHLDGFISLEDLKSVLFQFTLPMSEQLFAALMDRWVTLPMFYLVNLTFQWNKGKLESHIAKRLALHRKLAEYLPGLCKPKLSQSEQKHAIYVQNDFCLFLTLETAAVKFTVSVIILS